MKFPGRYPKEHWHSRAIFVDSRAHELFLKICKARQYFEILRDELIEKDGCPCAIEYMSEVVAIMDKDLSYYTVNPWCQEKKDN